MAAANQKLQSRIMAVLLGIDKSRLKGIRYLASGAEVPVSTSWVHSDYPDIVFADLGLDPVLPDQTDTVLDVILEEEC